ncbi:hypothetical protein M2317_002201 [Microbacterium sp. ZKA21]|uniref:hypothetical protein n=1 Tax=Microbacterium sp. ZKA21 TaxID=3381694 RepID=UPI003D25CA39
MNTPCDRWPLCDHYPNALVDTMEIAAAITEYLEKYGPLGYREVQAFAVGVGRTAGWITEDAA